MAIVESNTGLDIPETTKQKQLVIGSIPKLNEYFMSLAWGFVREHIETLQKECGDHEALSDIWQDIFFGRSFLYLGFSIDSDTEVPEGDFQQKLFECLTEKDGAEFVGFFILKMEEHNFHLWQAHIQDKYKGTSVFENAYEYLEGQVNKMGAPSLTFATHRPEWAPIAKKLGFKKVLTLYKKTLI